MRRGMTGYRFVDYATQGYIALVGLLVLVFHGDRVPGWGLVVLVHGAALVGVHALIRWAEGHPGNRGWEFLRHFYPVLLYTFFFGETGRLNRMFVSEYLDPVFIRWDAALCGLQPSLWLMERWPYLAVSELFYASYFSYYVMIVGVGLTLFLRQRQGFYHFVSVVSFVFYLCYLTYIFLPVMGPRGFFREIGGYRIPLEAAGLTEAPPYPEAIQGGLFFQVMAFLYRHFEAAGAAFPSSHVAVALCTCWFSWRYLRPIRWVHAVMVVLLCISTVYCRYHYAVDVVAGVLVGGVLTPLGDWLHGRWEQVRRDAV